MGTKRFREIGIAAFLMMVLVFSPVALAVAPVSEGTAVQEESTGVTWAPLQFLLQVWKVVINVGGPPAEPASESGLTQATEEEESDLGPVIDPNGRSL